MSYYRITKYNPLNRDSEGRYTKNEWIDFSDVGKSFGAKVLSLDEYKITEQKYINAVLLFMDCVGINKLACFDLEKNVDSKNINPDLKYIYDRVTDGWWCDRMHVPELLKLTLRGCLWGRLKYNERMFVHFGYDYYMYVGVQQECKDAVERIRVSGLFVEDFVSPYLDEDS